MIHIKPVDQTQPIEIDLTIKTTEAFLDDMNVYYRGTEDGEWLVSRTHAGMVLKNANILGGVRSA